MVFDTIVINSKLNKDKRERSVESLTHNIHEVLFTLTELGISIIEMWGLLIIGIAIAKEVYRTVFKYKFSFTRINDDNHLNAGLSSALEVLLAAEILKTITVTSYRNLVIIAVLIVLRIAMTLLLVWETSHKSEHGGTFERSQKVLEEHEEQIEEN